MEIKSTDIHVVRAAKPKKAKVTPKLKKETCINCPHDLAAPGSSRKCLTCDQLPEHMKDRAIQKNPGKVLPDETAPSVPEEITEMKDEVYKDPNK